MTIRINYTLYREDSEPIDLIIEGDGIPYVPAQISGPADNWHPSEGGEVWIERILDEDDKEWDGELTLKEERDIEDELSEHQHSW